jgi:hypothetical protein
VTAPTKTELLAKLEQAKRDAEGGLEVSGSYTVGQCLDDFLVSLEGLAPNTVILQNRAVNMLRPVLGAYKLRELSARQALDGLRQIAQTAPAARSRSRTTP